MKTKSIKTTALAVFALVAMSFTTAKQESKKVDTAKSSIEWVGKKEIGSDHKGTINVKEGSLDFKGAKLVGGMIVVDMNSINVTDLSGDYKNKLEGHLKSDDFFGVANHATSKIVFTKVKKSGSMYAVTGDITIKGKTETITFDLSVEGNKATASLEVDRTKFGIRYGSSSFFDNLKDKAISNNFELKVNLVF